MKKELTFSELTTEGRMALLHINFTKEREVYFSLKKEINDFLYGNFTEYFELFKARTGHNKLVISGKIIEFLHEAVEVKTVENKEIFIIVLPLEYINDIKHVEN